MSEPIPPLVSCAVVFLAAVATLLSLARVVLPATTVRRLATPSSHVTPVRPHFRPYPARHAAPLAGEATRSVRPYVVAAEQATRRQELEPAALGLDGPGPYVIHGVEVA
ncbi:hypothetical protein ACFWR9_36065 [Streptomyces sp. NPDC058534]|uniref:hypothetical protein n=1 Tax=Streptomyces sp. NPDC058534 TaxID=3346541 RepID=UPI0036639694